MTDLHRLQALGDHVAQVQDEWLDRTLPPESARDGFLMRMGTSRRRHRAVWLAAAAVAVGVLLGASAIIVPKVFWTSRQLEASVRNQPTSQDAWIRSDGSERVPIDFSDGSRITLEPNSRVRIAELRANGATLAVEAGQLDVAVKHHAQTDYRLTLGPFLVRVTGTAFAVSFSPDRAALQLAMREGTVIVSGCALGDPRPLRAGETLNASCGDSHFEITRGAAPPAPASAPEVTSAPAANGQTASAPAAPVRDGAASEAPRVASVEAPSWQALARAGKFDKALGSVNAVGFSAQCERATSEELGLLADVARYGNRPEQAIQALSALRRRFPGGSRAGVAAFKIARVHFDQRGEYAEAARWFRTYLREQPGGALAREAQGRLMEALYRSGDRAGAERAAESYLAANPNGPHARLARSITEH